MTLTATDTSNVFPINFCLFRIFLAGLCDDVTGFVERFGRNAYVHSGLNCLPVSWKNHSMWNDAPDQYHCLRCAYQRWTGRNLAIVDYNGGFGCLFFFTARPRVIILKALQASAMPFSSHDYRVFGVQAALQTANAVVSNHWLVSSGAGEGFDDVVECYLRR